MPNREWRRRRENLAWGRVAPLAAAVVFGIPVFLMFLAHFNNYDRDLLSNNVYHRTDRPFVYRTLLPTTVNLLTRLVPVAAREAAERYVSENKAMRAIFTVESSAEDAHGRLKFERHFPVETAIALVLMFGCFVGFLWNTGRLFHLYYEGAPWFTAAVPAMAALGFVPWISYTSHPYDLTTLLLSSLLYLALAKENWPVFIATFALSCLNKETSILVMIVFLTMRIAQGKQFERTTVNVAGALLLVFVVIKAGVSYAFRNNPGQVLEFHLFDVNAAIFANWIRRGYTAADLASFAAILISILHEWSAKPLPFRCGLAVVPLLAVLGLFFGVFDEWRQYTDAYTPLLLLALGSIGALFGARRRGERSERLAN